MWNRHARRSVGRLCRILGLAGLLGLSGCAGGTATRTASGLVDMELDVGGVTRRYLMYEPRADQPARKLKPLLFVFHGGGGSAQQAARELGDRLFPLADREDFYVVLPDASQRSWDFGGGSVSAARRRPADDGAFFEQLLDTLTSRLLVDPNRVFATGISRGGQASYFMGCRFPDRIRAIAPVAMPLPRYLEPLCAGGPPIGLALLNGTADPLVPYKGGTIQVGRRERDEVLSTDLTISLFRRRNGCEATLSESRLFDEVDDGSHVRMLRWGHCSGAPVLLFRIEGGGHTWPSGGQTLPEAVVGRVNRDIVGIERVWAFFSEFR